MSWFDEGIDWARVFPHIAFNVWERVQAQDEADFCNRLDRQQQLAEAHFKQSRALGIRYMDKHCEYHHIDIPQPQWLTDVNLISELLKGDTLCE